MNNLHLKTIFCRRCRKDFPAHWSQRVCSPCASDIIEIQKSNNTYFKNKKYYEKLKLIFGESCLKCKKNPRWPYWNPNGKRYYSYRKRRLVMDHVVPLSCGGENDISNLQFLCHRCNVSKKQKSDDYRSPNQIKKLLLLDNL